MALSLRDRSDAAAKSRKDSQAVIDKANEAAAEARDEEVVFYAWVDSGNQSMPSSLTMRISGGERVHDQTTGKIMSTGYNEIRFNMGILRTRDVDAIREIRRAIKNGDTITEDKEVYLSKVEKPELRAARLARRHGEDTIKLKSQADEIAELKAKLATVSLG